MKAGHILVVDDDPSLLRLLDIRLQSAGYTVQTADSANAALARVEQSVPDAVITDLRMDGMDGLGLLRELQRRQPGVPVLLLTAHGTIPDAVSATQHGAVAFLTKPVDREELMSELERALNLTAHADVPDDWRSGMVTRSPRMEELLEQARRVAATGTSVLIRGESGTGKELLARAMHRASPRRDGPFVAINCGAMPEGLLESELMGHERGAFTGAQQATTGLIRSADGGTLLLDEIGDMPLPLQVKLLRVLQERRVRPVGGTRDFPVDVRILSATHRQLSEAIAAGEFREDLFYRLNVIELQLPPLRERPEDIPLLINRRLRALAERDRERVKVYAPEAMERMVAARWPGNVRQLDNVVEQHVALAPGTVITAEQVRRSLGDEVTAFPSVADARAQFTRDYLVRLLKLTEGNVSEAARVAQRNRSEFYKLLSRHDIDPGDFKSAG
ncbi:sigma 54-interacting transcriptional regulator [Halofilum ochraceum]|uniref:sigma 54-interacting transcriptional regulator n=1 Tax=Halofilum ochraceum TaxID=1611323 RepID=UPI0008368046|nr:sigma 54-interacting transcriptional regulator [Halofilum ochraceum]